MIKIFKYLSIFLFILSCDNFENKNPNVKKSTTGICHKKGSQYYKQTKILLVLIQLLLVWKVAEDYRDKIWNYY